MYPGSEIYGGLAEHGITVRLAWELKNNIKNSWWNYFVLERSDIYGIDAAILMNPKVWEASGHTAEFCRPFDGMQELPQRFRADHIGQTVGEQNVWKLPDSCPNCGKKALGRRSGNSI